ALAPAPMPAPAPAPVPGTAAKLRPYWEDLRQRLARDGVSGPRVDALLATLGERTQSPMGRKMKQLYTSKFLPKPKPSEVPTYYKGVLTDANAQKCRDYLAANRSAFDRAQAAYGVPCEIAVSLLFVETRLGTVLGDVKENAFQTLASMAESRRFEDIPEWTARMPGCEAQRAWFDETMPKRADWAYNETRALVKYMLKSGLAPDRFPGSIYGAIGLCQFMPSNIETYGADGSGDGVIDLFDIQDAAMSLSRYLARHGWKPGIARAQQHKCLMAYNHAEIYANTILALSDMVKAQPKPASAKQAAPKQAAPKQAAPKPAKAGKAKLI
ncbi:MAG: lytic murein transglycosylase, partial [Desulfovibrio sp.]|nr:lytic murein transglycosylase [Desulfovibrio sp.]